MCFAYLREYEGERRLVVLNFGGTPLTLSLADVAARGEIVLSTELDRSSENVDLSDLKLRPHEGLIVQL
jgi:hypothetical protein